MNPSLARTLHRPRLIRPEPRHVFVRLTCSRENDSLSKRCLCTSNVSCLRKQASAGVFDRISSLPGGASIHISTYHLGRFFPAANYRYPIAVQSRSYSSKRKNMGPKKQVKEEKILLGRPGNNLKSGIVGDWSGGHFSDDMLKASLGPGGTGQCWKIDAVPSHHQMLAGQPCGQ